MAGTNFALSDCKYTVFLKNQSRVFGFFSSSAGGRNFGQRKKFFAQRKKNYSQRKNIFPLPIFCDVGNQAYSTLSPLFVSLPTARARTPSGNDAERQTKNFIIKFSIYFLFLIFSLFLRGIMQKKQLSSYFTFLKTVPI